MKTIKTILISIFIVSVLLLEQSRASGKSLHFSSIEKHRNFVISKINKLKSIMNNEVKAGKIVGGIIGFIDLDAHENLRTQYFEYGKKSFDRSSGRIDSHTLFEIGSITKTILGTALAKLTSSGVVNLEDPISRFIPELNHTTAGKITLLQLATHTSGLPRQTIEQNESFNSAIDEALKYEGLERVDFLKVAFEKLSIGTKQTIMRELESFALPEEIERKPGYSNFGYGLLGYALMKATGTADLDELLGWAILKDLKMTSTHTIPQPEIFAVPHFIGPSLGITVPNTIEKQSFGNLVSGAGALTANAVDLVKFVAAQMQSSTFSGATKDALRMQATVRVLDEESDGFSQYEGLGLNILTKNGLSLYEKSGGTWGSTSEIMWSNDLGIGLVYLINTHVPQDGSNQPIDTIRSEILRAMVIPNKPSNLIDEYDPSEMDRYHSIDSSILGVELEMRTRPEKSKCSLL